MKVATWGVFMDDVCLCTFNEEADATRGREMLGDGYTVKPLIVAPVNLLEHKDAWLAAVAHMNIDYVGTARTYWQRELEAMQAMYKELEK